MQLKFVSVLAELKSSYLNLQKKKLARDLKLKFRDDHLSWKPRICRIPLSGL